MSFDPAKLFWDAAYRAGDDLQHWEPGEVARGEQGSIFASREFRQRWVEAGRGAAPRFLDLGCGRGALLRRVSAATGRDSGSPRCAVAIGVDLSLDALSRARRASQECPEARAQPLFVVARAAALPLRRGSLDLVCERGLLHGLESSARARCLREVARVLRLGGELWLEGARRSDSRSGLLALHPQRSRRVLEQSGFEVLATGDSRLESCSGSLAARWWRLRRTAAAAGTGSG
jgi:SAM-dependent methyltransferase